MSSTRVLRREIGRKDARSVRPTTLGDVLLAESKSRWRAFCGGMAFQTGLIVVLVCVSALIPKDLRVSLPLRYLSTPIALASPFKAPSRARKFSVPHPVSPNPATSLPVEDAPAPKAPITPVITKPNVREKTLVALDAPEVQVGPQTPNQPAPLAAPAIPNLKRPKDPVILNTFGDPDGAAGASGGKLTGAQHVGASGFGGPEGSGQPRSRRPVESNLFADDTAPTRSGHTRLISTSDSDSRPAEILFRPKPVYTEEARAKKIEGVVVLKVLFKASGEVVVEQVLQSLGNGLDDSARAAAEQIKFKPALRNGQPVDFTANVQIEFQLAY